MDYSTLITSEHQGQPKFMAWLNVALGMIQDAQDFAKQLYTFYDIDSAVGTQLDKVGNVLSTPRRLPFQPSNNVSPIMDDATYRIVLRSRIVEAHFDGTASSLYGLFQTVLGNTGLLFDITDNQDMSMSVIVYGVTTTLIGDLLSHGYIVPKPEGVRIQINVTTNKVFAWGIDNEIYSGWGTGYWLLRGQ